jgi:4-amino-4-deoxychorismate lyase
MILINGEPNNQIDSADRGLQYGDGLFETIAVINGRPVFWDRHWQRLQQGCQRLYLPLPDASVISQEVERLCWHKPSSAVLKIIVTRGVGGRGYRLPENIAPTRILSLHPYPDYPSNYAEFGIRARFCQTRLGLNPILAGIKHLNRLEQIMARAEWQDPSIQEGILLDYNDRVIEGTMSNLFYAKDAALYTAPIIEAGVSGVVRGLILELAEAHGLSAHEQAFGKTELLSADEIFICNSIIGVWPLICLGAAIFPVGPCTRRIQGWFSSFTQEALNR